MFLSRTKNFLFLHKAPLENAYSTYRRANSKAMILIDSTKGRKLFERALANESSGVASAICRFTPQQQTVTCGPAAIANALEALEVDPLEQTGLGIWRKWTENHILEALKRIQPEEKSFSGLSFNNCNFLLSKIQTSLFRSSCKHQRPKNLFFTTLLHAKKNCTQTRDKFNELIKKVDSKNFLLINFCRNSFEQTGEGHWAVIIEFVDGFALVQDPAHFKYPAFYFVEQDIVFDGLIGRGAILITKN